MHILRHLQRSRIVFIALLSLMIGGLLPQQSFAQTNERCFPETGFCISGPIRAYWERNGGLPIFGYPITAQAMELVEGIPYPVQWFERDRLEDHTNEGLGVMAGRLGALLLERSNRPWQSFPTVSAHTIGEDCEFFAITGHSMCGKFRQYWHANGGLERFGYPITQPFREETPEGPYDVQYFERRRMELHPELQGTPVLLGLLGNTILNDVTLRTGYPDCLQQVMPSLQRAIDVLHADGVAVGCPIGPSWSNIPASIQHFEGGRMIWLDERKGPLMFSYPPMIYTLAGPELRPANYSDLWQEGDPDTPPVTPPPERFAPWRGFGKVWMEQPGVRETFGWALERHPTAFTVDTQLLDGTGLLIRFNETREVYVLKATTKIIVE